ncbi:ankyrin-1-like isoform X4 [Pomacea canaliculata]|uniref:ankyrin-1-like isoform X4 n=1 Tax=Pomacea canaliculata TaxID=400727 RepID=UPI000D73DDBF|nr:ankyrin-1-like isoform X4 [Pomacea canaliculata]
MSKGVDQRLDNGTGMLHLAVLAQNTEAVQYLTSAKISPKLQDKSGSTADQVCFNNTVKRHLPPKYLLRREVRQLNDSKMVPIKPSLQDKDVIFKLAANPKYFDEIQKKLQTLDFNVNTECDSSGDFLLHLVCRRGLSQLPLMMALVKIQGADVELCNAEGFTALMLAASAGNCVLCDVLMCLFGADPNKPNPNTGRTALHYAVEGNHRKTVECLIRRGGDVNAEDLMGRRPDDVPLCQGVNVDCLEIISFTRTRRIETLTERIRKGELEKNHLLKSDLYVVDEEGCTLVMTAALYNRASELETLLQINDTTINAQHTKTGMTALAMAAELGNTETVEVLLSHGANPAISDMKCYLPLHHAVLNNQEKVVDKMLEYFPQSYCGLNKAVRLCKRTTIHKMLNSAFTRRQEKIITPKLLECAMNGAADELFQLLDDGDVINPKSSTGNWPLYLAVENGHLDVVRLLFEQGGDIRKRHSTTGETVLHIAARMGHTEIVRYLLKFCQNSHIHCSAQHESRKMLDINTLDTNNHTSLQVAAEKGYSKIVQLLLQHGSTTALLDAKGQLFTCPQYEGVRVQIETHRQMHTKDVVAAITDRSRKALEQLEKIWLPRFDHNLRTSEGDTPLMVACSIGKLQILKFLLESAVYPQSRQECEHEEDSDADSGVLDPTSGMTQRRDSKSALAEELHTSGTFGHSTEVQQNQFTGSGEYSGDDVSEKKDSLEVQPAASLPNGTAGVQQFLNALLHDFSIPKGLYIYRDGLVSHVCAVNLFDGSTALHRAIEHGDDYQAVRQLLIADPACLNLQNSRGLSPLHLACKLGRKKVIEMLLATEGIDTNSRALEGQLPEEMTRNKSIIRIVEKAREQLTGRTTAPLKPQENVPRDDDSASHSLTGSVVNFDKLHSRYEALRSEVKDVS